MKYSDSFRHVRGETQFMDDQISDENCLHIAVFCSSVPHAKIKSIELSKANTHDGVLKVFTAKDILGENQIGGIIQDEELLAEKEVHFVGQPIAFVVASKRDQAVAAARLIAVEYETLPAIFDPREAELKGHLIAPSRTFSLGNTDKAWKQCTTIVEGKAETGAQEHIYLETQGSIAFPQENGRIRLLAGTQSPTAVQRITAKVLGKSMNQIEVEVTRLGGAFGGKEDQATPWAVMAALAADKLKQPVKLMLDRNTDMRITGKRHPYSSDFKIGLDSEGKILAYEVTFYQNSGASADLSTAILERTLFHATNSYYIPNVRATAYPCKTNLPPFTAFRGFGGPQGMFVIESAIAKAAEKIGIDPLELQHRNLLKEGDEMPYGARMKNCNAICSFDEAAKRFDLASMKKNTDEFNSNNKLKKKGVSVMPVCFGISFTNTFLNQAGALVHVYTDGSVSISTAAVEMGQGANAKIQMIAAKALGISEDLINIDTTSTKRVANTSPSAATTTVDLNGMAAMLACNSIISRLKKVAADKLNVSVSKITIHAGEVLSDGKKAGLSWNELIWLAYTQRVNLSAQAFYATPGIHFDKKKEKGSPFAYHVFGTAITEATVDCIRGTYKIDSVRIIHDAGNSLNSIIDLGQVEGALMQGIGWVTIEDITYDKDGRLLQDSLATYKIPNLHFVPEDVEVIFLEDSVNPAAVLGSKGVGEPPFMYGIGAYFALMDAMKSFQPEKCKFFDAPLTPEKVLMFLHSDLNK